MARQPKSLAHNSFNEPFHHAHSREYVERFDNIRWPDMSDMATNLECPLDPCVLCGGEMIRLETGEVVCANKDCFNHGEEEDEDEWDDNAEIGLRS